METSIVILQDTADTNKTGQLRAPSWTRLSFKRKTELQRKIEAAPISPFPKFLPKVFYPENS